MCIAPYSKVIDCIPYKKKKDFCSVAAMARSSYCLDCDNPHVHFCTTLQRKSVSARVKWHHRVERKVKKKLPLSDLVHGEADGLHVEPLLPHLPPVLLHQRDHHAAHVVVIVGVLQPQLELRVGPEGVCTSEGFR